MYGYIESQAQLLVANGSYVNASDAYDRTPLILVSLYLTGADNWYNRERFARLMLERKADPNLSDCYGLTPLIHAAINGQSDYVKVLLSDVSVGFDELKLRKFQSGNCTVSQLFQALSTAPLNDSLIDSREKSLRNS